MNIFNSQHRSVDSNHEGYYRNYILMNLDANIMGDFKGGGQR